MLATVKSLLPERPQKPKVGKKVEDIADLEIASSAKDAVSKLNRSLDELMEAIRKED